MYPTADQSNQVQFSRLLNNNNFTLVQSTQLSKMIEQARSNGKACQMMNIDNDLAKSLGIKVLVHKFPIKNSFINVHLFLTDRFPNQIPKIFLSEDIYNKKFGSEQFKYTVQNLQQYKKDGKFNISVIINRVQQQIINLSSTFNIKYVEDFNNLKNMFVPQKIFKAINLLNINSLMKNQRNPTKQQISQQFKLSKQYQEAVNLYNQMTQLNDSIVKYLREKNNNLEIQKNKILQQCYHLEKVKKEFIAFYCYLQSLKSRVNKFNVMQLLDEKIKALNQQIDEYSNKQFSVNNFNYYKGLMKQLKKLQLKRQRIN